MNELLTKMCEEVRLLLEEKYGNEYDNFYGKCIEASDEISNRLKQEGIKHKIVEGWCVYDDPSSCSDRPYGEHTWVEVDDIYLDVTATQFYFYIDEIIPRVIVGKKPYYMVYDEPIDAEY